MKDYLSNLPKELLDLIYLARDVSDRNNMSAYLVGGFVRDLLLGVKNLDLDIVVEGDGIKFSEGLAKKLNARLIRHKRFGTATVITTHKIKIDPSTSLSVNGERSRTIDIATARREFYPHSGSLPEVTPGTLKDDLSRRDFTINALAVGISKNNFGNLIDFFNGINDIRKKNIRILHNLSFIDDPTRILRAIRFEQRYNFKIEPHTLKLFKNAISLKALDKVSSHRLRDEIILILSEPHPIKYIKRINSLTGFSFVSPKFHFLKKTESFLRAIERQINWFKNKTPKRRTLDIWLMYLIGLMSNMHTRHIKIFCQKFAFSKGQTKRIISYKKIIDKLANRLKKKDSPSQIYKHLEPLSYEITLLFSAKYKDKILRKHIKDFFNIYNGVRIYTTGCDLAKLGVKPGPYYKSILTKTLYAKLDGKISTKEEELEFVKKLIKAYSQD